jgi:hypothetical protein
MLSLPLELFHREEGICAVAIFAFAAVLGEPSLAGSELLNPDAHEADRRKITR